jgi:DNA mismatch endonuclease Vsr
MSDTFSAAKRVAILRSIRSTRNAATEQNSLGHYAMPELSAGVATGLYPPRLPAAPSKVRPVKPDFVFPKAKLAIFLDGCFWRCWPIHSQMPEHNRPWWRNKLKANAARDARNTADLRSSACRVLRIWEHDLHRNPGHCVSRVVRLLESTWPTSTRSRQ